jgi:hypothetical protein
MTISMFNKVLFLIKKTLIIFFFSTTNEQIDKSSTVTLFAEEMGDLGSDEKKQVRRLFHK